MSPGDAPDATLGEAARDPDERILDALFPRIVAHLADGRPVDGAHLLPERPDLHARLAALVEIAARAVPRRPVETPRIAGYEIVRELGRGGMGHVHLARDAKLGRTVALKVLPSRFTTSRAKDRFLREARAVARLEHPRIVPVYELGEDAGQPFFTMQYVEGRTLAAVLADARRRGAGALRGADLSAAAGDTPWWAAAAHAALDVAEALSHAHAQGVVHRDVKPSNVLVRADGAAMLFDFGLADVEDEATLTQAGFLGTPHYASPEQAAGETETLDGRTDVWSLGATLFELLTLEPPFPGPTTQEVLRRIQSWEPEAPSRADASIPRDLDTIVLHALEKEREKRYASAEEMADDLRAVLVGRKVRARRAGAIERGLRLVKRGRALSELLVEQRARTAEMRALVLRAEKNERLAAEREAEARAALLRAERERDKASGVLRVLVDTLGAADPAVSGRDVRIVDALDRVAERATSDSGADDETACTILGAVTRIYARLGVNDRAIAIGEPAAERAVRALGAPHAISVDICSALAAAHVQHGDVAAAERWGRRAVDGAVAGRGPGSSEAIMHRASLAQMLGEAGRFDECEAILRDAERDATQHLGDRHETTAFVLHNLAITISNRHANADALPLIRRAWEIRRDVLGERHPETIFSLAGYGQILKYVDPAAAGEPLRRSAELLTETLGADHYQAAAARHNHAGWLMDAGRLDEAAAIQEALVASAESGSAEDAPHTAWFRFQLARIDLARGRLDAATRSAERARDVFARLGRRDAATAERLLTMIRERISASSPSG